MNLSVPYLSNVIKTTKRFDKILEKIKINKIGNGICIAEMKVTDEHTNPMGSLHGGMSATLIDTLSSWAILSHEKIKTHTVSVGMNINYLKAAQIGDDIEIDARTIRAGRNLAFLEILIRNKATGDLLVKADHTKFVLANSPAESLF